MTTRFYLSVIPESLIASMLTPEEFGSYYAVGTSKRAYGMAIFFEIDPARLDNPEALAEASARCIPHPNGRPKRSLYLSIYRVLESIPLDAFLSLYLTTGDGRVLELQQKPFVADPDERLHFYQEFCPVTNRIVSRLSPPDFARFITSESTTLRLPKIVFCNLVLRQLRNDPDAPDIGDLPYANIGHLRDCLRELNLSESYKKTKTVQRGMSSEVLYRTIKSGFFVGEGTRLLYYPMPGREHLEREHYEWWRSALKSFGE